MQEVVRVRGVWGLWWCCFALTYLLCDDLLALRCVVWWRVEIAKISVRRGLQSCFVVLLYRWRAGDYRCVLQRFCKICAKMARFCATICVDRFRSCYLKAVPDCAKDLRLGSVCQCSAPMFEAALRLWACGFT